MSHVRFVTRRLNGLENACPQDRWRSTASAKPLADTQDSVHIMLERTVTNKAVSILIKTQGTVVLFLSCSGSAILHCSALCQI